jgi:histidinol phosphatase-like enzyme
MLAELAKHNIRIDLIRYCPHKKEDECECKKPKPGMIIDAAKMLDLDLDSSWLIGDKTIDIKSAENASKKIKTILVRTGLFGKEPGHVNINPDFIAEDILDAVNIILKASHQ